MQCSPFETPEAAAGKCRLTSQHRRNIEAAFDRQITDSAAGQRADTQHLAPCQKQALRNRNALAAGSSLAGKYFNGTDASYERHTDTCSLDGKGWTLIGNLQRASAG